MATVPSGSEANADKIDIRRATRLDLLSIYRLEKALFDQPWPYSAFERFLGEPAFLIAEHDQELLGYVVADWTANFGRDVGHIKDLAVHPDAQRHGIGRRLLQRAVSRLLIEGVSRIKLEVREGNMVARRLYENEGFERFQRVPGYYSDGEAALVLVFNPNQDGQARSQ